MIFRMSDGNWTPSPNFVLEAIAMGYFKKNEIRILSLILRNTLGFKERSSRQEWTRELTHSEMAKMTMWAKSTVTSTLSDLVKRNIVNKHGKKYKINLQQNEWIFRKKTVVKNLDHQASLPEESKKPTKKVVKLNHELTSTTGQTTNCEPPKETLKETSKEIYCLCLIKLWNYLTTSWFPKKSGGIPSFDYGAERIKRLVDGKLKGHTERDIRQAIYNYHKFMNLGDGRRKWKYIWDLYGFLENKKDNVARFKNWEVVEENWVEPYHPLSDA